MAVLQAYFDNSGDGQSPVYTVAAAIATQGQWIALSSDWNEILKRFGVSVPFHMTDYNSRVREFSRFRGDDDLHLRLMASLAAVVRKYEVYVVADAILSAEAVVSDDLRNHSQVRDFKDPYSLVLLGNLAHIASTHRQGSLPAGRIACFMDADQKRKGRNERIVGHAIKRHPDVFSGDYGTSNRHKVPIQVADVMAFEVMKRVHHLEIEQEGRDERKSLRAMLDATGHSIRSMKVGAATQLLSDFGDYIREVDPDDKYG